MLREVERGRVTCSEEVGDVFHLHEGHAGFFEAYPWRSDGEVRESTRQVDELVWRAETDSGGLLA